MCASTGALCTGIGGRLINILNIIEKQYDMRCSIVQDGVRMVVSSVNVDAGLP